LSSLSSLDSATCTTDAPCVVVLDTSDSSLNDWLTGIALAAGVLVMAQLISTVGGWRSD
jgi:hypothetical protein